MAAIDDETAARIATRLCKHRWLDADHQHQHGLYALKQAIKEFAEPPSEKGEQMDEAAFVPADAELIERAHAEGVRAFDRNFDEAFLAALDTEKGDAMDDATAKRIALRLRERNMAQSYGMTCGPGGEDLLVTAIQEAAEPPPPKPGLYFIRGAGGILHFERLRLDPAVRVQSLEWYRPGETRFRAAPDGDILSGPHTCEELLEAVQKQA